MSDFCKIGGEFPLSGKKLTDLLSAVLEKRLSFRFQAKGNSMFPVIRNGDIVTISPLSGYPQFGDIVAVIFSNDNRTVIHRIIGKKNGYFILKGDNSSEPDGLIPITDIVGRVTCLERKGKIIRFERRFIRLTFVLIVSLGMIFRMLRFLKRKIQHE